VIGSLEDAGSYFRSFSIARALRFARFPAFCWEMV
jgi:hypothetical protein